MSNYIKKGALKIDEVLYRFITEQALPGTKVDESKFWQDFESVLADFTPRNQALLAKRDSLQRQINEFHIQQPAASFTQYKSFLEKIAYLLPQPKHQNKQLHITTENVDDEIARMAGPQLVVPINNARYALNAVNARWGSLYDALYGTDAISEENELAKGNDYNPKRGQAVIERARAFLDQIAPLANGSHQNSIGYHIEQGELIVSLVSGETAQLANPERFIGFTGADLIEGRVEGSVEGNVANPSAILLKHKKLHVEIQFDANHPIGASDPAHIKDLLVESALTTIMDCEDSVAAVDAQDKTLVYQNWLGLMQGNLSVAINKGSQSTVRAMNPNREYIGRHNQAFSLSGRSLMFVRNVGHLMTNSAILFNDEAIFEGIMDGVITSLIAKHDLLNLEHNAGTLSNSKTGSIYIVKPKMHGPEEVAFTNDLFVRIENMLGLTQHTLKVGIMDEERRTSVNLAACIEAAKARVVFINTGFLDRTGDEIHTSMLKGAFAPKAELKTRPWIHAYEKANVMTGLRAGLSGKAQIGKGMWPIPDQMHAMLAAKIAHPKAGANTAWVPSPTGATLHALHYHEVDVFEVQKQLQQEDYDGIDTILDIPLQGEQRLSESDIQHDLDNNVQGILGYVVRWVHQGIGCSKVPDINNVGLMEDRATLRISSQHIANWLHHGLVSPQQINASMEKMAALVDQQNSHDADYIPMLPDLSSSIGFQAAKDLIFKGKEQPNGYTEPLLHARRLEMKQKLAVKAKPAPVL